MAPYHLECTQGALSFVETAQRHIHQQHYKQQIEKCTLHTQPGVPSNAGLAPVILNSPPLWIQGKYN